MPVVMKMWGTANGGPTPYDGQFLKAFDFEAHDGIGEITMTTDIAEAMQFPSMVEQFEFYRTVPKCKPIREDGRPNRPMTASNWEIITV